MSALSKRKNELFVICWREGVWLGQCRMIFSSATNGELLVLQVADPVRISCEGGAGAERLHRAVYPAEVAPRHSCSSHRASFTQLLFTPVRPASRRVLFYAM